MERTEILPLFRDQIKDLISFTDGEWALFNDFLVLKTLKKDQCLVQMGKHCEEIGFVIKGCVRYCNHVDGQEITGYFSFEGSFVTALKSYFTNEPCLYEIKALEDTLLVTLSRKTMQELFAHPLLGSKIERFGRLLSEKFNVLLEDRLKSFIVKSPEERYLDLLASGDGILDRIPLQFIAQYIGVTPVSLSRIRKRILQPGTAPQHRNS